MQAIQLTLMQALIRIVTPNSPAYGNNVAFEKAQTSQQLQSKLQPGDIVFSRTNSSLYELARRYMGISYDHVAVVISNKQVIHISPPIISKIDMGHILHPSRQPIVIRPKTDNLDRFLTVIHNFLGQKYNISALAQIALNQLSSKMQKPKKISFSLNNLKYSRICSDAVLYALCKASSKISQKVETDIHKTRYQQLGFFMPDEIAQILLSNDSQILLKSVFKQEHLMINKLYSGSEKMIDFARKASQLGSKSISTLTSKYSKLRDQKANNKVNQPNSNAKLQLLKILTVLMALGQTLGVLVSNKVRFAMVGLNMMLIMGQVKQIRDILQKNAKL